MLAGDRYEAEKQAVSFHGNQYTLSSESGGGQIDHHQNTEKTRERIAAETGTSESFVKRASQFSQGATAAEEVSPGFRQEVLSGKVKPTQQEMQTIARASPEERKPLVDVLLHPKSKPQKAAPAAGGEDKKDALAAIQKISEDMEKPKPGMTEQDAVQQFEWKVTRMLQAFDSTFREWPALISEAVYRGQIIKTLEGLKQYILHIIMGAIPQLVQRVCVTHTPTP